MPRAGPADPSLRAGRQNSDGMTTHFTHLSTWIADYRSYHFPEVKSIILA